MHLGLILVFSLNFHVMAQSSSTQQNKQKLNSDIALKFINDYKKFCDSRKEQVDVDKWVKNNTLLTDNFKSTYIKIMTDAYKAEPELGLDFDPIFNAQYYPDKGFTILNSEEASGFITLAGIDKKDFQVTVKIIYINNQCLVDGAGIINIPKEKQRKP